MRRNSTLMTFWRAPSGPSSSSFWPSSACRSSASTSKRWVVDDLWSLISGLFLDIWSLGWSSIFDLLGSPEKSITQSIATQSLALALVLIFGCRWSLISWWSRKIDNRSIITQSISAATENDRPHPGLRSQKVVQGQDVGEGTVGDTVGDTVGNGRIQNINNGSQWKR